IISGKLSVEVVDDDNNINKQIDRNTIFALLDEIEFPEEYHISQMQLKKLFDLCQWSLEQKNNTLIILNKPSPANAIMWRKDWLVTEATEQIIKTKIDPFDEGKE